MEKNIKKCLVIGGLTVVFWLISLCISGIVGERTEMSEKAQREISQSWSGSQDFVGPVLCVPVYSDTSQVPHACMFVLPERFDADVNVQSETLHRGIFDASVFRAGMDVSGSFNLKEMRPKSEASGKNRPVRYDWSHTQVIVSIGDKRGVEEGMKFTVGDKQVELNKHLTDYGNSKLVSVLNRIDQDEVCQVVDLSGMIGSEVPFTLKTELKGSEELNVAPVGQQSQVTMHGNSTDPSFCGILLPSSREVTDTGFSATWKVNSLNRNDMDQVFYSTDYSSAFQTVGAKLLVIGGQYTQTDRALKYAFLVILLSLAAVFVGEMSVKSEINLLNYLLIGAALVLFYLMLLSFGEWMGFSMAYGLSALLIIGMITVYLKAIVGKANTALAVCLFMTLIDVFIYVLLGIADMALLVGTLGLFFILGVAMFFSLRITAAGEKKKE